MTTTHYTAADDRIERVLHLELLLEEAGYALGRIVAATENAAADDWRGTGRGSELADAEVAAERMVELLDALAGWSERPVRTERKAAQR